MHAYKCRPVAGGTASRGGQRLSGSRQGERDGRRDAGRDGGRERGREWRYIERGGEGKRQGERERAGERQSEMVGKEATVDRERVIYM